MKPEVDADFLIINQEAYVTDDTDIFLRINDLSSIYEVVKVTEGVPQFFEEHAERFRKSAEALGVKIQQGEREILKGICLLAEKNGRKEGNVKLIATQWNGNPLFLAYFLHSDPVPLDAYTNGIHTILFKGEREAPHVKALNSTFRARVTRARQEAGAYEALLANKDGYITEGSRSNFFF